MLGLVFQNLTAEKIVSREFFNKILSVGINELGLEDRNIGISVNIVSEIKIKELNWKYRKKNRVTDVLSFPVSENLQSATYNSQLVDVGDIFICLPFAKKEAKRENVSIKKKLAQLTVHGFLHLVGHDHEKSEVGARQMLKLENKILSKIKI